LFFHYEKKATALIKRLLHSGLSVLLSSLVLLLLGWIVWFFTGGDKTSLQDVLFYVGAAPIALFAIGLFGDSFGRGSSSTQLSRSVTKKTANQRALRDAKDNTLRITSGLNWMMAGLVVWLVSYFL